MMTTSEIFKMTKFDRADMFKTAHEIAKRLIKEGKYSSYREALAIGLKKSYKLSLQCYRGLLRFRGVELIKESLDVVGFSGKQKQEYIETLYDAPNFTGLGAVPSLVEVTERIEKIASSVEYYLSERKFNEVVWSLFGPQWAQSKYGHKYANGSIKAVI